jgi:hypothetical protein
VHYASQNIHLFKFFASKPEMEKVTTFDDGNCFVGYTDSFSSVSPQKLKMAASGQNGGIFQHRLADRFRFLLSSGIFVQWGMLATFVISSKKKTFGYIQTFRHPSIA